MKLLERDIYRTKSAKYIQYNIKAPSSNNFCRGKAVGIKYYVCVCVCVCVYLFLP